MTGRKTKQKTSSFLEGMVKQEAPAVKLSALNMVTTCFEYYPVNMPDPGFASGPDRRLGSIGRKRAG